MAAPTNPDVSIETKVTVSLLGSESIKITYRGDGLPTAAEIVQLAADALDVDVVIDEVALVNNAEQVGPQDPVQEGTFAASTATSNGGS